ncbi:hypothetical protein [Sanguibacter antarcticus]|uniref:Uncharacterized protein n=1 Tax=Sanguibacter antarcticus TaxID=372484 RepID=A0A2A9E9D5_9MICO|nr:hypothetical protein [Sanguibacter antarcticus]PFG34852.1 hypothetical protein ATL42_2780 [Sanguibacter antarcticus]
MNNDDLVAVKNEWIQARTEATSLLEGKVEGLAAPFGDVVDTADPETVAALFRIDQARISALSSRLSMTEKLLDVLIERITADSMTPARPPEPGTGT